MKPPGLRRAWSFRGADRPSPKGALGEAPRFVSHTLRRRGRAKVSGRDAVVTLRPPQRYNFLVNAPLPKILTDHLDEIRALCDRYRVQRLAVFGSAANGTFDPDRSDVDFVVEFEPLAPSDGWHSYFALKFALVDLLRRPVDLIGLTSVENPFFRRSIELTQRELYAA